MSFQWDNPPTQAWGELVDAQIAAIRDAVRQLVNRYAPEIQAWMMQNAPWQDQSGLARQTLSAEVNDLASDALEIVMSHGMSYGVYLELAHGGRWAIIGPAIDHFAPRIWNDVLALFR